jgi:SSS family transporter
MASDRFSGKRLLIPFVALCVVLGATAVGAEPPAAFEDFIAPFTLRTQAAARSVWDGIEAPQPPAILPPPGEISDADLLASLAAEKREPLRVQLEALRNQLSAAITARNDALDVYNRWQTFSDRIQETPELGAVYLESLRTVDHCRALLRDAEKAVQSLQNEIQSARVNASLDDISRGFTLADWAVIAVYLVLTTVLGGLLAGKQASMKDFFLGGRRLPWPAVCGSIIATELSAATFLIGPAIVFSQGGDMTYIQLAIGTILARFIIGWFFIPAFYEREIYSPYDYMGNRLGPRVKHITTGLFMIGGVLAQGARVYIAAKALQVITGTDTTTSILIIGVVSILWTIMGGITTVIWTDALQFLLFTGGAIAALVFAATAVDGGISAVFSEAWHAGKFRVLNLNFNPKEAYTLWCGLIGFSFLTLASHGTDQMLVQRMFTCRNETAARKAIVWSGVSQCLTYLLLLVGAGVFVYYKHSPLSPPEQVVVSDDSMKVFAVYIVNVMPPVMSGLLMSAVFATAISTLDSLLAALAQSTIDVLYKPFVRPEASDRHYVRASRVIVLFWGLALTAFAICCDLIARRYGDLIQFALAMAAYTYGALLGTFLLAFLPTKRDDLGLMWGVPLSMLTVFALNWHQPVPQIIVLIAGLVLIIQAFRRLSRQPWKILYVGLAVLIVWMIGMAVIGRSADGTAVYVTVAWPWHFPIGTAMTFVVGYLVGNKKDA